MCIRDSLRGRSYPGGVAWSAGLLGRNRTGLRPCSRRGTTPLAWIGSAARRKFSGTLELDDIAVRVVHVERGSHALGAISFAHFARLDAGGGELGAQRLRVERGELQRHVVHVAG